MADTKTRKTRPGLVLEVTSGETIVIKAKDEPNCKTVVTLSGIKAPKLGRRANKMNPQTPEEPFAWEAREFLRKKLLKKVIDYTNDEKETTNPNRFRGTIYLENENINELLCREGLAEARSESGEYAKATQEAKEARKGKHVDPSLYEEHTRDIRWEVENLMEFVSQCERKRHKATIERIIDGSTVEACIEVGDQYVYVTLKISGIKCPSSGAMEFIEALILQEEVEIRLESVVNSYMAIGSIFHPKGNIAEALLRSGYAQIVDWSLETVDKEDAEKLRQAEKHAKDRKLIIWEDYNPQAQTGSTVKQEEKNYVGTVTEIINGDALMVKHPNGTINKIFLAGIRPPREQGAAPIIKDQKPEGPRPRNKKPLYDVPWLFEAREFLRKKLIGKKVNVTHNYTQKATETFPAKVCCNVTVNNLNIAEALVSKGYATVLNYRADDDNRPSAYNSLKAAEEKAKKGNKGIHAKKDIPVHRINDICGDPVKAKSFLPHIKRMTRVEALVEFVHSGSRLRLYLPKDSSLITFLLSGIEGRFVAGDPVNNEEKAAAFTKEKCMQRDVEIQIESTDRNGNFIGWLWVDNVNMSAALVESGLAKIHFSGENSKYADDLRNAKNRAIANGVWKYIEKDETKELIEEDKKTERQIDQKEVMVVCATDLTIYCQYVSNGAKLNALQDKLVQEMAASPPLPGAFKPRKGDICAAKYPEDNVWYRAKIEKIAGNKVRVHYIDYGNKADVLAVDCAVLPAGFSDKGYAHPFELAFVEAPSDPDDKRIASEKFSDYLAEQQTWQLNVEYVDKGISYVTLTNEAKQDLGKRLVEEGYLLVSKRKEKRLKKILQEYEEAENTAKLSRVNLWVYGDVRADDDKEFGMGR